MSASIEELDRRVKALEQHPSVTGIIDGVQHHWYRMLAPVVRTNIEYTDEQIEDVFGSEPNCLVIALLRRAQAAEKRVAELEQQK